MKYARTVLWIAMIGADAGGFAFLFAPAAMIEWVGLSASAAGLTEIRAVYGGVQLGLAAFLWWSLQRDDRIRGALVLTALALGGIAACRIAGLAVDQAPTAAIFVNLAFEVGVGGFALLALRGLASPGEGRAAIAAAQKAA